MEQKTRRTPRKDSSYVIYEVTCAETGANYIGLTRKGGTTVARAVKERWRKHISRARNEDRKWALYVYLNSGGLELTWTHKVLMVVRGRAEAYAYERMIVKELTPELNDQYIG